MRVLRIALIAFIWCVTAMIFTPIAIITGPYLEERLFPILVDQHVSNVRRLASPDRLVWEWHFKKSRRASPQLFAWTMHYDSNDRYVIEVKRGEDCAEPVRTSRVVPPYVQSHSTLCSEIPHGLRNVPALTVVGFGEYHGWHSFYTVGQALVPVQWPEPAEPRALHLRKAIGR